MYIRSSFVGVTVIVLSLALVPATFAIDNAIGIRGGVGLSQFRGSSFQTLVAAGVERESLVGFELAAVGVIGVTEVFAVQPEFGITSVGGSYTIGASQRTERATYVIVPVLAKFVAPRSTLRPTFVIGPSAKFLIGTGGGERDGVSFDYADGVLATPIFAVVAGVGLESVTPNGFRGFDIRVSYDLQSYLEPDVNDDFDQRVLYFSINGTFATNLGRDRAL